MSVAPPASEGTTIVIGFFGQSVGFWMSAEGATVGFVGSVALVASEALVASGWVAGAFVASCLTAVAGAGAGVADDEQATTPSINAAMEMRQIPDSFFRTI